MTTTRTLTNYFSDLKKSGKLTGTIRSAVILHNKRRASNNTSVVNTLQARALAARIRVSLGDKTGNQVRNIVHAKYPIRKNWLTPAAAINSNAPYCVDIDNGRYSSKCTYTHWTYRPTVGSWARIRPLSQEIVYQYSDSPAITLRAPHGYKWDRDVNGLRLVSLTDPHRDYHPDSDDLLDYSPSKIRTKLITLDRTRRAEASKIRLEKRAAKRTAEQEARILQQAEREGCMVCVADSVRAGNCSAGTKSWAERHGLNPAIHYRPTEVLSRANGDARRVALVVAVALRRHTTEMQTGYCTLADHGISF